MKKGTSVATQRLKVLRKTKLVGLFRCERRIEKDRSGREQTYTYRNQRGKEGKEEQQEVDSGFCESEKSNVAERGYSEEVVSRERDCWRKEIDIYIYI